MGVTVNTTEPGNGTYPAPGDFITVHYVGRLKANPDKIFDSSRKKQRPFRFRVGGGEVKF